MRPVRVLRKIMTDFKVTSESSHSETESVAVCVNVNTLGYVRIAGGEQYISSAARSDFVKVICVERNRKAVGAKLDPLIHLAALNTNVFVGNGIDISGVSVVDIRLYENYGNLSGNILISYGDFFSRGIFPGRCLGHLYGVVAGGAPCGHITGKLAEIHVIEPYRTGLVGGDADGLSNVTVSVYLRLVKLDIVDIKRRKTYIFYKESFSDSVIGIGDVNSAGEIVKLIGGNG